ncbi:MAG: VanZ family protein [Lachnospiraceae bacterium]|nr:VanZ family protein [Lachnospiraceae bacterium]
MSKKKKQKDTATQIVAVVLFMVYLAILLYLLFLSDRYGRTTGFTEYHYNLKPFGEIRRYILHRESFNTELFLVNIVGNVVAFMPFGFLLPLTSKNLQGFFDVVAIGFLFSLLVETMQLLLMVGTFDVDDLILNVSGVMLGYACYALIYRRTKEGNKKPERKSKPKESGK